VNLKPEAVTAFWAEIEKISSGKEIMDIARKAGALPTGHPLRSRAVEALKNYQAMLEYQKKPLWKRLFMPMPKVARLGMVGGRQVFKPGLPSPMRMPVSWNTAVSALKPTKAPSVYAKPVKTPKLPKMKGSFYEVAK